jgi:hypothetical protein
MVTDARWLARYGYRVARGGYLTPLDVCRAADFLAGFLAGQDGTACGAAVHAAAAAAGLSPTTLKRARLLAGVTLVRTGNPGGGRQSVWSVPGADQLRRLRLKERRYRQRAERAELARQQAEQEARARAAGRRRARWARYQAAHREELAARQRRRHWAHRDAELRRKAVYRAAQRAAG